MKKLICLILLVVNVQSAHSLYAGNDSNSSQDSYHFFLLRGLTRESGHWGTAFEENLRERFKDARVTYLDLPGSGVYFKERASASVAGMMEFMRVRIEGRSKERAYKNVLVATSLGSMVATEWVNTYPEDFDMVCLVAPSLRGVCTLKERVKPEIRLEMIKVILAGNIENKESIILRINSNDTNRFDANLRDWVKIQTERPMSIANTLRQTIAGMRYSFNGDLSENVPFMILASKGDRLLSEACVEKVHDRLGGELVWHDSAGHGLPIDAPEWIAEMLEVWILQKQLPTPTVDMSVPLSVVEVN